MLTNSKHPQKAVRIPKKARISGFTLVELIVVITILAILATIGFLALSGYSQDAKDSAIKANVRSLQTAISAESAIANNSPRYYVVHDTDYALSWAFAYVDGASVALTGGDVGSVPLDSNYTAGKPDFKKLRLNPDKFRISAAGLPGGTLGVIARATGLGADSAEAAYDANSLMAAGADFPVAGANGRKRMVSYVQAWAVAPATKTAVVTGNFPSSNVPAGTVSWLLRAEPGSATNLTGALVNGTVGNVSVTVAASGPANCQAIKTATPTSPDGAYSIDPDGAGGNAAFQAYCDMTTDGGGWTRVMNLGADTRYFNAKWWQAGSDDITTNSALADLDMKIGPAYQSIGSFSDMLFVDPSASANWVSINSLGVSQSLYALVWPSNSVVQAAAKTSSVIPVTNATQVRKGGTWDFGNPEGALTLNGCGNGNQTDAQNECVRIGPKFTYAGQIAAWHGFWASWDNGTGYNSGRTGYKIGILPSSKSHGATYVYVR